MFDSFDVAAYLAQQLEQNNHTYNNTKIQRLMFIAYGTALAWKDTRLCEEYPRVWPHGPVFPKIFHYINNGGSIATLSQALANSTTDDAEVVKHVVDRTVEQFGTKNAGTLVKWSISENSPWTRCLREGVDWNSFMPDEYIKEYFLKYVITVPNVQMQDSDEQIEDAIIASRLPIKRL